MKKYQYIFKAALFLSIGLIMSVLSMYIADVFKEYKVVVFILKIYTFIISVGTVMLSLLELSLHYFNFKNE